MSKRDQFFSVLGVTMTLGALATSQAIAQETPVVETTIAQHVGLTASSYKYTEDDVMSLKGNKFGFDYGDLSKQESLTATGDFLASQEDLAGMSAAEHVESEILQLAQAGAQTMLVGNLAAAELIHYRPRRTAARLPPALLEARPGRPAFILAQSRAELALRRPRLPQRARRGARARHPGAVIRRRRTHHCRAQCLCPRLAGVAPGKYCATIVDRYFESNRDCSICNWRCSQRRNRSRRTK